MKKIALFLVIISCLSVPVFSNQELTDLFNNKVEYYKVNISKAESKAHECREWEKTRCAEDNATINSIGFRGTENIDKSLLNKHIECKAADKALNEKLEKHAQELKDFYLKNPDILKNKQNECKNIKNKVTNTEKQQIDHAVWNGTIGSLPKKLREIYIECRVASKLNQREWEAPKVEQWQLQYIGE